MEVAKPTLKLMKQAFLLHTNINFNPVINEKVKFYSECDTAVTGICGYRPEQTLPSSTFTASTASPPARKKKATWSPARTGNLKVAFKRGNMRNQALTESKIRTNQGDAG
jgi:hypothetical protein